MALSGSAESPVWLPHGWSIVDVGGPASEPLVFEITGCSALNFMATGQDAGVASSDLADAAIDKALYKDVWLWENNPDVTPNDILIMTYHHFSPTGAYHIVDGNVVCDTGFLYANSCWLPSAEQSAYASSERFCGIVNFKHVQTFGIVITNIFVDLFLSGSPTDAVVDSTPSYTLNYTVRRYNGSAQFFHHADETITTDAVPLWTATGTLTGVASATSGGPGQSVNFNKDGVLP